MRASDHEVEVEWEVPPTAAEYEVTVQQLGQPRWLWPRVSRLEVELEWLVMVAADVTHYTNATRAEAASHGGKGGGLVPTGTRWADGRLLASYVLGGLSMDKSFMLRLRARNNATGWGAATRGGRRHPKQHEQHHAERGEVAAARRRRRGGGVP